MILPREIVSRILCKPDYCFISAAKLLKWKVISKKFNAYCQYDIECTFRVSLSIIFSISFPVLASKVSTIALSCTKDRLAKIIEKVSSSVPHFLGPALISKSASRSAAAWSSCLFSSLVPCEKFKGLWRIVCELSPCYSCLFPSPNFENTHKYYSFFPTKHKTTMCIFGL